MSDPSIDLQQVSENMYIVSAGDVSITVEVLREDNYRMSTVSDDGTTISFELSVESRPVSNVKLESTLEDTGSIEKVVLINGTKFERPVFNAESSQHFEDQYKPPQIRATPYNMYWWDGILLEEGYHNLLNRDVKYPHPVRGHYGISLFDNWEREGTQLVHNQIDRDTTAVFLSAGPSVAEVLICTGVGALIGAKVGKVYGAIIGAIAGAVISGFAVGMGYFNFLDESGCIWWWVNKSFVNWLEDNALFLALLPVGAEGVVLGQMIANGYIRIGSLTLCEGVYVNIGDPVATSPYYAVSTTPSFIGNGYVNNKDNILGAPDGSYAYLNSGSYGNKAEISATLSHMPISGQVYLRCYTPSNSGANLKVYVCDQYGVWTQVVNTNLYPANSVMNINCGYRSNIVRVSIVAYHEYSGYPSYVYADAVWIQ
ncbi:MAG: hypothetical protein LBE76_02235 [Nitrososphaerota archaeon]|nr:hypothetical protein [Nitrososphaerota archaeon]